MAKGGVVFPVCRDKLSPEGHGHPSQDHCRVRLAHHSIASTAVLTQVMDITQTPSSSSRTMDPDTALGSSSGLDATPAPVTAQATEICTAPAAAWSQVVHQTPGNCRALSDNWSHGLTKTTDFCGTMDPDTALGRGPCLDVSVARSGSTGHPGQLDPRCSQILRH